MMEIICKKMVIMMEVAFAQTHNYFIMYQAYNVKCVEKGLLVIIMDIPALCAV